LASLCEESKAIAKIVSCVWLLSVDSVLYCLKFVILFLDLALLFKTILRTFCPKFWLADQSKLTQANKIFRLSASCCQCFHKSSMKFPFLSVKFPFFPLIFLAKITKFPFKFPSYSETSQRLWRRLRINNLYSGASSLMRLCLKRKDVEHTGS
jgi:hypothetical protein